MDHDKHQDAYLSHCYVNVVINHNDSTKYCFNYQACLVAQFIDLLADSLNVFQSITDSKNTYYVDFNNPLPMIMNVI